MWQEKLMVKKSNPIAGLYPFTKLWIVLLYAISASILSTIRLNGFPVYMMISFLIVPILAALSGIFSKFIKVLNKMIFLAFFIIIVQMFFVKSSDILISFSFFGFFDLNVYTQSLQYALVLAFSILCLGGILAWFFETTENKELICACEKKGMDPKASYILLSTLQMITVLQKSSKTIMSSQQARGVETEGNVFIRSKAFIPSMIPLVLGAITSTEERVLTLESKGFLVKGKKTRLFDVQPNGNEKIATSIFFLFALLILVWRILLWVL